ncbi:hypothetical protein NDU88_003333 [Pleurodeles waltl]|uniref:Uncharacterized protein n=1 Tax=Pleurodeles waltl TaxID=8319 RepID=A0AAV7T4H1_PLEWA|nr:hypothetical protein NDU88_003333 [Pleurodeles waltl]
MIGLFGQERTRALRGVLAKEGTVCKSNESIAEAFAAYYEEVYTLVTQILEEDCAELLRDIPLPGLSDAEKGDLDAELTEVEVASALQGLQSGKAAGTNGVPVELFKCLGSRVTKHMLAKFREAQEVGLLSLDQRTLTIVLILKKDRPLERCASYRPISLLNTEAKVLAKALATRLHAIIAKLTHPYQSGIMPSRSTRLNLRILYGVPSYYPWPSVPQTQCAHS